jgi:hypothetical protein
MDFVLYPSLTIHPVETLPSCAPVEVYFVLSECHIEFLRTFLNKVRIICPSLEIPSGALKGTVPRDFSLQICFMNEFPQASENPIRAFQIFFKNARRYLQLKMHYLPLVSFTPVMEISGKMGPPVGVVDTCNAP